MTSISYRKVKSVAKDILPKGETLHKISLKTMGQIAEIVGSTLGPGGCPVLIERQETGFPNMVTKDGVTVFRSLGFVNPIQHAIMETARDASVRTATEAGDGPQPLWSKVLTPNGWVTMGEVKVGMKVCGTNGSVQTVLGVYPKGLKEIVKITFESGLKVECCEDHLWTVTTSSRGTQKTLTVKEMINDFVKVGNDGYNSHKYYVNKTISEFANREFSLDPYLLGVLLGDGSLGDSGSIEIWLGKPKHHVIGKLQLPEGITANATYVENKNCYRVKLTGSTADGKTMRDLLEDLGLRNTNSNTKFIPHKYLFSGTKTREKLLQGLMDTDGYVNGRGLFEFSTVSAQLAQGVTDLLRSLGKSVYSKLHTRENDENSYGDKPIYRIHELAGNKYGDKIVNIEKTGVFAEMQCIKVSNEDHLYITDNYIPTHNTTSATVLADAFFRYTHDFLEKNPKISPQKVVRIIENWYRNEGEKYLKSMALKVDNDVQRAVALCSSNGDSQLTDAVMECFEITGDEGNVTIVENSGPSGYQVEQLKGYAVNSGYEESCGRFFSQFINDKSNGRCHLKNPLFVLYYGSITEMAVLYPIMEQVSAAKRRDPKLPNNVVLCAMGFSENVIASLAASFQDDMTLNIYPMVIPKTGVHNSELHFLQDIQAISSSKIFNPLSEPLESAELSDLGPPLEYFESLRYRSNIVGTTDESLLGARIEELKTQLEAPESIYEKMMLQERVAKLTGGIARLTVVGASSGEIREKKDRAEDAVCAIRGALKSGALPGGGWGLFLLAQSLVNGEDGLESKVRDQVIRPSLLTPIRKLMTNCGLNEEEIEDRLAEMARNREKFINSSEPIAQSALVWDGTCDKFVLPVESGIVDAMPAVTEAIRNAISIATLLGTLGGCVVFQRDTEVERTESADSYQWLANSTLKDRGHE